MPGQGGASLTDEVRIAIDDGVMVLSFNRPAKKNALSLDMYRVLAEALEEAEIAVFVQRLRTREAAEAFQAFAERRPPDFMKLEEKP